MSTYIAGNFRGGGGGAIFLCILWVNQRIRNFLPMEEFVFIQVGVASAVWHKKLYPRNAKIVEKVHLDARTHTHTHTHTHTRTLAHTHTHVRVHTHTHTGHPSASDDHSHCSRH